MNIDIVLFKRINEHSKYIRAAELSSDGRLLATASWDRSVMVWDTGDWMHKRTLVHEQEVHAVAWHPRDNEVLSAGSDGLRSWSIQDDKDIMFAKVRRLRAVAWLPDGERVVVGDTDGHVYIYARHPATFKHVRRVTSAKYAWLHSRTSFSTCVD
jgi:WD40 repeat protein